VTFLNPIGLAGLIGLPVILALHLLYRRKQRYVVSHLGLWSFLDAYTHGPRARRLPLTWILLLDLLIGALLSLAWSRPSIAIAQPERSPRHSVILLDVSTSMRATVGSTTRFAEAKAAAAALLRDSTPRDVVTLLTFGQQARLIADSRAEADQTDFVRLAGWLDQIQVGETGHALAEALAMGQAALDPGLPAEYHVITDGGFPLPDPDAISQFAYPLRWHWVGREADNQAVVDLNAAPQGANQMQVFARLANFGSQAVIREAVLAVDGQVINQVAIDLPAGSSVPHVWQIPLR